MNDVTDRRGEEVLAFRGLTIVDRQGRTLVDGATFGLRRGERLGIVGESGSGKSLTLKTAAGILPRGLSRKGEVVFGDGLGRSDLAMIFQEPATSLNPTMRVGDFVARTWHIHHRTDSWKACMSHAEDLMAKVGIDQVRERMRAWPFELSGGLRQRVMIAAALAAEPSILLCDEPTTALDVRVQAQILALLNAIVERDGLSLIFVSHDLAVISQICTRVVVMRFGEIMEVNSTEAIIHHPQNAYTRMLLDADLGYRMEKAGTWNAPEEGVTMGPHDSEGEVPC